MAINNTVENINNQPTIEPRTVTGIFTKYIAKTLPLAFDESMSYYECLCALLEYLNETIVPDINNTNDGLSELQGFYTDLQNYVNNYFDNLDVQEEINNKLDALVKDGTLENLIGAYIQPRIDAQNTKITNIETKVNSVASGSPARVFNTYEELVQTNPDHSRTYVVSADGKWYYYNGTNWVAGGIYQATSIGNGTVHESSFTTNLKESIILQDISTIHNVGKFINDNGVLVDNESFTYSDLFDIPAFQTLHIRARGYLQNISMIAIYDENNNYIGVHVLSIDSTVRDYKYINNTSTTLHARVSYSNNTLVDLYLSNENNKDLSNLNENVGLYLNYKNIVPTFVQNHFVDRYGAISENRSFEYSNPIELKTNETIRFYGKGYLDTISLISICNKDNTSRTPVVISKNSNPDYFEYTASTDIYVCLCSAINVFNNCIIYNKNDSDKNNIPNTSFISSFLKLGVIGDSLASGETAYRDSNLIQHFIDNYDISWGQYLARKNGNTVINFSAGGLSTRTWLTSSYGLKKALLPENLCTGYIIGLGVNDSYHLGPNYLGTIADIKQDYNENPDTFYGNYGKIIGNIKSITKNAKIFILTMPNEINASQTKLNYNQAIRNIANHYGPTNNVFLIDLAKLYADEYTPNSFIPNCERAGHYNSIAYNYMGDLLEKAISEYMYNNYNYFKEVEYINTDYKW